LIQRLTTVALGFKTVSSFGDYSHAEEPVIYLNVMIWKT